METRIGLNQCFYQTYHLRNLVKSSSDLHKIYSLQIEPQERHTYFFSFAGTSVQLTAENVFINYCVWQSRRLLLYFDVVDPLNKYLQCFDDTIRLPEVWCYNNRSQEVVQNIISISLIRFDRFRYFCYLLKHVTS